MKYKNIEEDKQKIKNLKIKIKRIFTILLGTMTVLVLGFFIYILRFTFNQEKDKSREEKVTPVSEQEAVKTELNKITVPQVSELTMESRWNKLQSESDLVEINILRKSDMKNKRIITEPQKPVIKNNDEAYRQKILSLAKSLALRSLQLSPDSSDLKALLACQAFLFNERYQDYQHDNNIYNSLYESLKSFLGETYNVYEGHTGAVRSVFFVPGASDFYTGGTDGKILRWNIHDPVKSNQSLAEGIGDIELIRISSNGKYLVCAEKGKGLLLFDLESGVNEPEVLKGNETSITGLTIGPENHIAYATGSKNTIEYWNLENRRFMVIAMIDTRINSLDISPDGSILAGGTMDGRLIIWKTKGKVESETVHDNSGKSIFSVVFSSDNRWLACGDMDGDVMIFKTENFELDSMLSGHTARITDIKFSPDNKMLAASYADGAVLCWDLANQGNSPIVMDDNSGYIFSVAFSPDGKYILSAGRDEYRLVKRTISSKIMAECMCNVLTRNFTVHEWNKYVNQDIPYEKTCLKLRTVKSGIR